MNTKGASQVGNDNGSSEPNFQTGGSDLNSSLESSLSAKPTTVHGWFEAQAKQTPDAIAVICEGKRLTYSELDREASLLANHLVKIGVAILGVLKAGGAYVPIDVSCPKDRMAFILEDVKPPVVVTETSLLESLPPHSLQVVCLDAKPWDPAPKVFDGPHGPSCGQDPAYVIFTSGSTGQPKGVLVTHQNVVRLFTRTQHWFGFNERDVWTLFHSFSFDFSVWEMWGALLSGGTLVVVPLSIRRNPREFYELLARERITVLNQTPSAFLQLMHAESLAAHPKQLSLRYVIFGGEALTLQSLQPWFSRHGDERPLLVNMYGITETTVHVTYRPIRQHDLAKGLGSVIGEPIPDLEVWLLDDDLQPVAVGMEAEIYVGGAGVALGYLNRPELTAEKFIPNPFGEGRLYRSGDLVRRLPDGELEYLGRKDQQVKIRGFRVELGEIESHLLRHPLVREAVVILRGNSSAAQKLVAYLVLNGPGVPAPSELREFLRPKLPDYMIPLAFVVITSLPLTPNGKLDRQALLDPDAQRQGDAPFVAPHTATEEALAQMWASVLEIKQVSIDDNFFELGGNSLLAVQFLWEAKERFARTAIIADLLAAPTVRQFAALLDSSSGGTHLKLDECVQGEASGAPLFYVPGFVGFGLFPPAIAKRLGSRIRYYDGLHYAGLVGHQAPFDRIEDIAAFLLKQIRAVWPDGPYHLCGFSFGGVVAFEIARQMRAQNLEVGLLMLWDSEVNETYRARTWSEAWSALRQNIERTESSLIPALARLGAQKINWLWNKWMERVGLKEAASIIGPPPQDSAEAVKKSQYAVAAAALQAEPRYQPGAYSGKIVLVQTETSLGLLHVPDPTYGWDVVGGKGVELIKVSGQHFAVLEEPAASVIAERIIAYFSSIVAAD
jgi:amino acid adenylation domain-containing protein